MNILLPCIFTVTAVICGQTPQQDQPANSSPFQLELSAFEAACASAVPLGETYPENPAALVSFKSSDAWITWISSALGAALWRGDRAQITKYVLAGVDMRAPVWAKALQTNHSGDLLTYRTFPVHMAINAVYMEDADTTLFTEILASRSDPNAIETLYNKRKDGRVEVSQQSLLNHAVTAGKIEMLEAVLKAGVKDINFGSTTFNAKASPLFAAVLRKDVDAVGLLLKHGADSNLAITGPSGKSQSPIALAEKSLEHASGTPDREKAKAIVELLGKHKAP